jgi:putative tryptophan/tyrosine transport system substrate-binding protein
LQFDQNRRGFITLLGGAAAWPLAARAQQSPMPVVGVLASASAQFKDAFVRGLSEAGYIEGQNVRVEYRWAAGAYDRLSAMADELVNLRVNVIATFGAAAAPVAKAASTKVSPPIPVVFVLGSDPVAEGLVASLNRPGGNVTGATTITGALTAKRLELLRAAVGGNAAMAILINPSNPLGLAERSGAEAAARDTNQTLEIVTARNESEIVATFASLKEWRIGALIIGSDSFYLGQMRWMAALAAHNRVPAIGPLQEFTAAGGLMNYGPASPTASARAAAREQRAATQPPRRLAA